VGSWSGDRRDVQSRGDVGIDRRLDDRNVFARHEGDDARGNGHAVLDLHRQEPERRDVLRGDDADALSGHGDDRAGARPALALRQGGDDDAAVVRTVDGGRRCRRCGERERADRQYGGEYDFQADERSFPAAMSRPFEKDTGHSAYATSVSDLLCEGPADAAARAAPRVTRR